MKFKLIEETLAEKYPYINTNDYIWHELIHTAQEYGPGWNDLIIELIEKIDETYKKHNIDTQDFKIEEIKEKYGGLRIYASSIIEEVYKLISEYEDKADTVCDICGDTGSLYIKNGWLETLCKKCACETGYKKADETQDVKNNEA